MANSVANERTNRFRKPATIVSFLLLLLSVTAIASNGNSAFAMGPAPEGCASSDSNHREYNGTFKSFVISNGVQSVDVLNSQGAAKMNVDINKGYTVRFTLHALNTGITTYTDSSGNPHYQSTTFSDSKTGSVWASTNVWRNFNQSYCYKGFSVNGDQAMTFPT